MRVAVTGAGGFVGRTLVQHLLARGHSVIALGRRPISGFPPQVQERIFDPNDPLPNAAAFEGSDAVVHLAGESVAGRWTHDKKARIAGSRSDGTRAVVNSITLCSDGPRVLLCASASGYYGDRGDEPLTESSLPGNDFLANVCVQWERQAMRASGLGLRCAILRTGIALGNGGALEKLRTLFAWGAGGPLGGGRQFVPWIHVEDLARMYVWALERDHVRGPINAVTPDYATNARFSQAIGAAMRRPSLVPAPAPALRLVLGEFAGTLLGGQLIIPAAAADMGFEWAHPNLERALQSILDPHRQGSLPRTFLTRQRVPGNLETVFDFFSRAQNLELLTPPFLRFKVERLPATMQRGAIVDYQLRLRGLPVHWKTLIAEWDPPHRFVDVQLHGPYASWRHEHTLHEVDGGVEIVDSIQYVMPFLPFGGLAEPMVHRDVERIFAYRQGAIRRSLPTPQTVGV